MLEKNVEELLARELEGEVVLVRAVPAGLVAAATAAGITTLKFIAGMILVVAREHVAPDAAATVTELRLGDILGGNADLFAAVDVGDAPLADRLLHRLADLAPEAADEAAAVDGALVPAVIAPVDDADSCHIVLFLSWGMKRSGPAAAQDDLRTRRYHSESSLTCFSV